MFTTVITVILSLSFLVFIHELGHFLAAKAVGVHVIEFSIGFPPKLFSKMVGKTEYLISLIPIGGYVRLKGQGIEDEDETDPENYAAKSALQKLLILVSGPLMNLLVTLVLLPLVFIIGYKIPSYLNDPPVVSSVDNGSPAFELNIQAEDLILAVNDKVVRNWREVQSEFAEIKGEFVTIRLKRGEETINLRFKANLQDHSSGFGWHARVPAVIGNISLGSPAEDAGLHTDDLITHLNGEPLKDWTELSPAIQKSQGQPVTVAILRNGQPQEYVITPQWEENQHYWVLGIGSKSILVSENFQNSVVLGVKRAYVLTVRTFEFLFRLIAGQEKSESVGGPIMIAKMMGEAVQTGISDLLTLVAFISLQFAIFNLMPIPALDGGHIFFLLIEAVTGKTLSKNLRLSIQRVGFSLLLLLILYISVQDGIRLFRG